MSWQWGTLSVLPISAQLWLKTDPGNFLIAFLTQAKGNTQAHRTFAMSIKLWGTRGQLSHWGGNEQAEETSPRDKRKCPFYTCKYFSPFCTVVCWIVTVSKLNFHSASVCREHYHLEAQVAPRRERWVLIVPFCRCGNRQLMTWSGPFPVTLLVCGKARAQGQGSLAPTHFSFHWVLIIFTSGIVQTSLCAPQPLYWKHLSHQLKRLLTYISVVGTYLRAYCVPCPAWPIAKLIC